MKIALVYDRINKFGGAERVLTELHRLWPEAPVFTSVYDPEATKWSQGWDIRTSFLQLFPPLRRRHEMLGWLMPRAFESLGLSEFEIVISVTSEAAKGVITSPQQLHICYLLTPTRYLWSHEKEYLAGIPNLLKPLAFSIQTRLREWDFISAQRPDHIISISKLVQQRCRKYYRRESELIYPPLVPEIVGGSGKGEREESKRFFLVVSRLVGYKRIDLAIRACQILNVPLVVVGIGAEAERLKSIAGPMVRFVGNLTDEELVKYYRSAKALLMPQEEDFGLAAIEALSQGTPIISYEPSGTTEVIKEGKTGIFFRQQTVESLIQAIKRFANMEVQANFQSQYAKVIDDKFSSNKFKQVFLRKVENLWEKH